MADTPNIPPSLMIPMNAEECQQDMLRRVHKWLIALEERIIMLLQTNDLEAMKPGEREQAVSRHLMMLFRLMQLRQQYAEASPASGEQTLFDTLLRGIDME